MMSLQRLSNFWTRAARISRISLVAQILIRCLLQTYTPFVIADSPDIIFGNSEEALADLNNSVNGKGFSFDAGPSSVDHLLFFYQEEAGFALDDLVSHDMLAEKYRQSPGEYGHSTHQDADFYNLELVRQDAQNLQDWCRALGKIVPDICQHIHRRRIFWSFFIRRRADMFMNIALTGYPNDSACMTSQRGLKGYLRSKTKMSIINLSIRYGHVSRNWIVSRLRTTLVTY